MSDRARLYFRVLERSDGLWACRTGRRELDAHSTRAEAVAHIVGLAGEHRPSKVFIHLVDGRVLTESILDGARSTGRSAFARRSLAIHVEFRPGSRGHGRLAPCPRHS